jgi:Lrp/AsnC family leucine-responsive transcriptional regulator
LSDTTICPPASRCNNAEVVECHRITGEDCFSMKAHVRSIEHLEELIDRFTPYGRTTTSIIQSSPVPQRGLAVPAKRA